jgi:adenosylhomocysteine nucleosidase
LYDASIAFIGMSGEPPVIGPVNFGTATAGFSGRVDGVGVDDVVVVVDDAVAGLDDDEQPLVRTSASRLSAASPARALTIEASPRASATLDDRPIWPHRHAFRQAGVMEPARDGRIAFVFAMPIELAPLVKKLSLTETEIGGVAMHEGELDGRAVVATVTGMGTELATKGTTQLLDAVPVRWVLVVGITGALESETPIGTLVLPEIVVNSETGREFRPAPLADGTPAGRMWTTNGLTTKAKDLEALRAQGVVSLDMETAAIAELCEARGIPWSVFRVISDRANDGTVDEEVFHLSNQDGTPNPEAIERYMAEHPERLPLLAQMAEDAKLATRTAVDAAIAACPRIP